MDPLTPTKYAYQAPWYAGIFHRFPHYAVSPFEQVDGTFNWEDRRYMESLLALALAVCLWLGMWLVIYAIYFIVSCCPRCNRAEKQRRTRGLRWTLVVVALLTAGAVALALFGNEELNEGLGKTQTALAHLQSDLESTRATAMAPVGTALDDALAGLNRLQPVVEREQSQVTKFVASAIGIVEGARATYSTSMADLAQHGWNADSNRTLPEVGPYNQYRWIGSLLISVWLLLLCVLVWIAAGCKSRWVLLVAVALLVLSLILVWGAVAGYLPLTVAIADICVDPNRVLRKDFDRSHPAFELYNYYLTCEGTSQVYTGVMAIYEKLGNASHELTALKEAAAGSPQVQQQSLELRSNLTKMQLRLMDTSRSFDCRSTSRSYSDAAASLCYTGLAGSAYALLGFTSAGLLMIIAIFLAHVSARHVGTKKAYLQVDVQDAVAIRDQPRNEQPLHYRFSQVSTLEADSGARSGGSNAAAAAGARASAAPAAAEGSADQRAGQNHTRHTPPPAYHIDNAFFSSYGTATSQGTLDSRQGNVTEPLNANRNTFH